MEIKAKVVADSITNCFDKVKRITTFEIEFPRFILCFDEKTEILAQVGDNFPQFMSFKKAKIIGAKVAQYETETEEISFVEPLQWVENFGVHKMVNFDSSESKKFSLSVTDNHRVLVDKRTTGNTFVPEVWRASDLLGEYPCARIRQAGYHDAVGPYSKEEIALMVWFASDGTINGDKVHFKFKKQRKVSSVKQLLDCLGIEYEEFQYGDYILIKCNIFDWVLDCYTDNGLKKLPECAWKMTNSDYLFVKDALLNSGGSVANSDFNSTSVVFSGQVQVLAHMHGDVMNLRYHDDSRENKKRLYKSKFKSRNNHILLRRDNTSFYEDTLEGTVYCVTVPTSFVVVRREGIVHISGNCEVNTHKMLSKNTASSRAIPVGKVIEQVDKDPAMPVFWGKNRAGMQATEEVEGYDKFGQGEYQWLGSSKEAIERAKTMSEQGYHKQITNRLLEPFQMCRMVITGTEWDNFFFLRRHEAAQPEFKELADRMFEAMSSSSPVFLLQGDWHLPYYRGGFWRWGEEEELYLEDARMISVSCCAQTSFRKQDDSLEKARDVFKKLSLESLTDPKHGSPTEHQATPIAADHRNIKADLSLFDRGGVTAIHKELGAMSGNLAGWIQYRQLIPNHTKWEGVV